MYKPSGHFRDDARWNSGRMAVEFSLEFRDAAGERLIPCRVSWEALSDAASFEETSDEEEAMELFDTFREHIHAAVDRKLKAAIFEPDGSILIHNLDLGP